MQKRGLEPLLFLIKAKLYRIHSNEAKEQASVLFVMCMKIACILLLTNVWLIINDKKCTPLFSLFMTVQTVYRSTVNEL